MGATKSSGQRAQDRPELPAIAETLSDPIVGALDGTIHTWNAGAERLFGYRAEEVIGKPVSILYPPDRLGETRGDPPLLGTWRGDRAVRHRPAPKGRHRCSGVAQPLAGSHAGW